MTTLAYLPEICENVGQEEQSIFVARFTAKHFICQALFLILLGASSLAFGIQGGLSLYSAINIVVVQCIMAWYG